MALAVGATITTGTVTSAGSSVYTKSHTTDANTKVLVLGITAIISTNDIGTSNAKWNGITMYKVSEKLNASDSSVASIWILKNPPIGSYTAEYVLNGSSGPLAQHIFLANVTDTAPASSGDSETSGSDDPSVTYTVKGASGIIFDICMGGASATPGASQTAIFSDVNKVNYFAGASYRAHSGSNTTMSYTTGTGFGVHYAGVEIRTGGFVPRILLT